MGTPFHHLPTFLNSAAAARDARHPVAHAGPAALSAPVADPGDPSDLVARALAILADETEAWHARRAANRSTGTAR